MKIGFQTSKHLHCCPHRQRMRMLPDMQLFLNLAQRHAVMLGIRTCGKLPLDKANSQSSQLASRRHNCHGSLSVQSRPPPQSCNLKALGRHRWELPGPGRQDSNRAGVYL
eukprot:1157173-Pelagomonas_calceolata.AAC.5